MSEDDNGLRDRIARIATDRNLDIKDIDTVVGEVERAGVTPYFHHLTDDDRVADVLYGVKGRRADLFDGAPAATDQAAATGLQDPAFRAFLGGLANDYAGMPAQKKLYLQSKFKAEQQASAQPSAAADLKARELEIKHGPNWLQEAPSFEVARWADLAGVPRPQAQRPALVAKHELPGSGASAFGENRLIGLRLHSQLAAVDAELASLRGSSGGGPTVGMHRASRILQLERHREALERRSRIL